MTSTPSSAPMSPTPSPAAARPDRSDKLVLRDPQAFDQATQPQLRQSLESQPESGTSAERDKLRGMWEQLESDPEVIAARLQERKQLLQDRELRLREAAQLKQRSQDLETALQSAKQDRFHHPLVYGGAAALVGVAGLWLFERRKRIAWEEKALHADAQAELTRQEDPARGDSLLDLYEDDTAGWSDVAQDFAVDIKGLSQPTPVPTIRQPASQAVVETDSETERVSTIKDALAESETTKPDGLAAAPAETPVVAAKGPWAGASAAASAPSSHPAMDHLLELRTMVSGLMVLGRPQEAALLLTTHIELEPETCAWAYLECMQLLERLDQREDFDRLRDQYRVQFNRMPPSWHEPNAHVLGLDGYARASVELSNAWSQGAESARQTIAAWLHGPLVGRKFMQLPAFHDLFDLYEMLEFMPGASEQALGAADASLWGAALAESAGEAEPGSAADFLPTVSLLDLDYEFPSDLTLEKHQAEMAEKTVTVVKPGEFSLDFHVEGAATQGLFSQPAALSEK